MKRIDRLRISYLAGWALISVLLAGVMASPYLPHTTLHAQSVGPGGVPGRNSGGAVSSVFGRTGTVVAGSGDYAASQVANAAATNAANTFTATQEISGSNLGIAFHDTTFGSTTSITNYSGALDISNPSAYGNSIISIYGQGMFFEPTFVLGWADEGQTPMTGSDTSLSRVGADVLAVGNGIQGNASGTLELANLILGGAPIEQAATAPTSGSSCSALEWVLSNDGHLSYCSGAGGTWAEILTFNWNM